MFTPRQAARITYMSNVVGYVCLVIYRTGNDHEKIDGCFRRYRVQREWMWAIHTLLMDEFPATDLREYLRLAVCAGISDFATRNLARRAKLTFPDIECEVTLTRITERALNMSDKTLQPKSE